MKVEGFQAADRLLIELFTKLQLATPSQFVPRHLQQLLKDQHEEIQIESVRCNNVNDGSLEGISHGATLTVDAIDIPMELHLVVVDAKLRRYRLGIELRVRARGLLSSPNAVTDMRILSQEAI